MNKDYYDRYAVMERNHWWFLARERILSSTIRERIVVDNMRLNILNVGVATGRTSEWLSNFGTVTSLEYDQDCCDYLKEVGIEVIQGSLTDLPFEDETYDLVCAFDVIEHIENDEAAMHEIERVLKIGGHSFITVPALMSLWSEHDVINHHFRRYTKSGLLALFKLTNLYRLKISYFNTLFFPLIYIVRMYSRWFRRNENVSDFDKFSPDSLSNTFCYKIFSLERHWLRRFSFPVGVSLMSLLQKR